MAEFVEATELAHSFESPIDDLAATAAVFLGLVEDPSATHRGFLALWGSAVVDPDLRARMAALDQSLRSRLSRLVRQGVEDGVLQGSVDPDAFAVGFLGQLRGVALQYLIEPGGVDLELVAADIERSLRLIGMRPAAVH
ncbi:MAG: TetR family transcriptional regulator C-terminal domain-containing protein [Acidimicrobiales bacterium]